jgi:hypothetical protein
MGRNACALRAKRDEERKKKQVPHPSALRAYRLRMTMKIKSSGKKGRRPTLNTEAPGTRKGYGKSGSCGD